MKKALKRIKDKEIFFYDNGIKKIIDREDKDTYPRELSGNISGLYGNISSELSGNISSGLYGNISGLFGDCSNIRGDIEECELTKEERETLINIKDLIDEEEFNESEVNKNEPEKK